MPAQAGIQDVGGVTTGVIVWILRPSRRMTDEKQPCAVMPAQAGIQDV